MAPICDKNLSLTSEMIYCVDKVIRAKWWNVVAWHVGTRAYVRCMYTSSHQSTDHVVETFYIRLQTCNCDICLTSPESRIVLDPVTRAVPKYSIGNVITFQQFRGAGSAGDLFAGVGIYGQRFNGAALWPECDRCLRRFVFMQNHCQ